MHTHMHRHTEAEKEQENNVCLRVKELVDHGNCTAGGLSSEQGGWSPTTAQHTF